MSLADEYKSAIEETDTTIEKVTDGDGYPVIITDTEFKKADDGAPLVVLIGKIAPISKEDKKAFGDYKGKGFRKYHKMTNPYAKKGLYGFVEANGGDLDDMETLQDIEDFLDEMENKPKGRMYYDKPKGKQYPDTLILFGFEHKGKPVPTEVPKTKKGKKVVEEEDDDVQSPD